MSDLLALAGAIVMIVAVLMLRGVLAIPFARMTARFVPGAPVPAGLGPLFDEAAAQLRALGFGEARWILASRADGEPATLPLVAAHVHVDGGVVWLGPPLDAKRPHRLYTLFAHRLADGRTALSQPFDPFFAATADPGLVARAGSEPTLEAQWAAHRAFVAALGPTLPFDDGALIDVLFGERHRQALLAQGLLRPLSADVAVPRFTLALRMLVAYFRTKSAPVDPRPVPPERLALLARIQDVVTHRAPPRRAQWTLFAVSVALFMAIGAVIWDATFALILLVVVMIHELGHFFAMRAFGYRNVHVLALPLVGGVAMGVDANPSATRRAWMSLMGPLPGILIGWVLIVLWFTSIPDGTAPDWLFSLAIVFLLVNYLNVLPMPPLDGAHVVESLLPLRHARLQTVFIGVAATIGGIAAWLFELRILTFLAVLQLIGLPALWKMHGAERELAADAPAAESRATKMLRILRALERHLGPTTHASMRVTQALQIATRLDTKPMSGVARVATSLVYAALLVVPIGAVAVYGLSWLGDSEETVAAHERQAEEHDALTEKTRALPLLELVQGEERLPAAATQAQLEAAQQRLGRPFPQELRDVYLLANGLPEIGIGPVEAIVPAAAYVDEHIAPYSETMMLTADNEDGYAEVPLGDVKRWWLIGGDDESALFYLPDEHALLPHTRVVGWYSEDSSVNASIRELLADRRVMGLEVKRMEEKTAAARVASRATLRDASIEELVEAWPELDLAMQLVLDVEIPDAAEDDAIAAAEAKLGVALDAELRELYALRDGFDGADVLPVGELARFGARAAELDGQQRDWLFDSGREPFVETDTHGTPVQLTAESAAECIVVGGNVNEGKLTRVRLLWCDTRSSHAGWIDVMQQRRHASFRDWLLELAVPVHAANHLLEQP